MVTGEIDVDDESHAIDEDDEVKGLKNSEVPNNCRFGRRSPMVRHFFLRLISFLVVIVMLLSFIGNTC